MRLRAIRLRNVRQFGPAGAAIEGIADGVNVLAAPNEFGKTTVFEALKVALLSKATSKHRDVLALVPDPAGGAPEIELDLDVDGAELRLVKRFMSSPTQRLLHRTSGRLEAQGSAVDDWLGKALDLDQSSAGPARLLWLDQGQSLKELAQIDDASMGLRELVAQQVGEVASGERTARLLDRARRAQQQLVTADRKRPKRGGPLEQALAKRDAGVIELEALERRADAAEAAIDEVAAIDLALANAAAAGLSDQLGHRLQTARAALDAARRAADARALRAQALAAADAGVTRAGTTLRDLEAAHRRAREAISRLETLEREATAATTERERAEALESTLRQQRDTARAAHEAAAALAGEAQRALIVAGAARRLSEAQQQLADAEALHGRRIDHAAARAAIRVDAEMVAAIEKAADTARQADVRLAARRASLRVTYDGDRRIHHDGKVLPPDRDHPVPAPLALDLEGIGRLTIDPGERSDAAALEQASRQARSQLDDALAAADVTDLEAARRQLREAERLELAIAELDRALARLAPEGVDGLAAEVRRLRVDAADAPEQPSIDLDDALGRAEAAKSALDAAEQAWRESIETLDPIRERASERASARKALAERVLEHEAALGPAADWPRAVAEAAAALADAQTERDAAAAELSQADAEAGDVDAAAADVQRLEQALANEHARLERLRLDRARLAGDLRVVAADGVGERLAEARVEHARLCRLVDVYETECRALACLIEVLETSEAEARRQFTRPVMDAMTPLLAQVLPETVLELDDGLAPKALQRGDRTDAMARLSGGTREQIAVLVRLGFARLLAHHGRHLPVILDDGLVFSDDTRIERMFTALSMVGDELQLLVLTCRERTFRTLGGTALRIASWPVSEG